MNILVTGVKEKHQRSIDHIIQLFYEESKVQFTNDSAMGSQTEAKAEEKLDLIIGLKVLADGEIISAYGQLTELSSQKQLQRQHQKMTKHVISSPEWEKIMKQTQHVVLLELLQEYTGMEQPWGVLTGIRPTKLLHQLNKQSVPLREAKQQLQDHLRLHENKLELMEQIIERQLTVIPDLYELNNEVSIYIGIPFCPTKCAYCTFPAYAINGKQGSVDSFLGGLHYEMRAIGQWLKERNIGITTVYFGGGTPTSITAHEMDMLYEEMYESFPNVQEIREVTVEAGRPDTITVEKLEVLKKWNIDRISINPQSYIQQTLQAIGRHHTVEETIDKFKLSRSMGMHNINMDLIIGLPGEGLPEFEYTLQETGKLMPESLTVHTLSFKRASEMTRNKEKYKIADRKEVIAMMNRAREWTNANGYKPYYLYRQKNILGNLENIGYAKPGQESIYNIMIMEELQTIIGLGCGAASKWVHPKTGMISRFANPKEPKAYNDNYKHYTEEKLKALEKLFAEK